MTTGIKQAICTFVKFMERLFMQVSGSANQGKLIEIMLAKPKQSQLLYGLNAVSNQWLSTYNVNNLDRMGH